jgi:hypothetical protein
VIRRTASGRSIHPSVLAGSLRILVIYVAGMLIPADDPRRAIPDADS